MYRVSRFLLLSLVIVFIIGSFGSNAIAQYGGKRVITIVRKVTEGSKDELFQINTTAPLGNTVVQSFEISENSLSQSFEIETEGTYTFTEELLNEQISAGWKLDPNNPPTCEITPFSNISWDPIGSSGVSIFIPVRGPDESNWEIYLNIY